MKSTAGAESKHWDSLSCPESSISLGDWLGTHGLFEQIPSLISFKAENLTKYV